MHELVIDNLTKAFNNGRTTHVVLSNLSFAVQTNEFLSIVGPSGCGKTTLLNIIAGFVRANSGTVMANDKTVDQPGPDRAFVFQNYALFPWMTVKDNVLYPMKRQKMPRHAREERLKELLAMVQLEGKENLYPHQLSGGMQQRTSVIRALACRPRLLLMDEPLGALDVQMRRKLQQELESIFLKSPVTVIMVTHDIDEAVFLSDRVIVTSAQGCRILADLPINLSRPRNRRSRQFHEIAGKLADFLENIEQEYALISEATHPEPVCSLDTAQAGGSLKTQCKGLFNILRKEITR